MSKVITLHSIRITSSTKNPHQELARDMQMVAQVIIKENIYWQPWPVHCEESQMSWKVSFGCKIPSYADTFLIAVLRHVEAENTRLLGFIEIGTGEVLASVEMNKKFRLPFNKVNPDGPSLDLTAGFSVSEAPPTAPFGFAMTDIPENEFTSVTSSGIKNHLLTIYKDITERAQALMNCQHLSIMHERIFLHYKSNEQRAYLLNLLGDIYFESYQKSEALQELTLAVCAYNDAVRDAPGTGLYLANVGKSLQERFDLHGNLADINKAVSMWEEAVMLIGDGHEDKLIWLSELASSLLGRFERFGDIADLDRSVLIKETVVENTPDNHAKKPLRLSSLGISLSVRYEHLGYPADLDRSMLIKEAAVLLTLNDDPSKPGRLINLGISLLDRFDRFDDLADLQKAVSTQEAAVRLAPDDHPNMPSFLMNLGSSLMRRFERLGDIADIIESVSLKEVAVGLTPDSHPDKPLRLSNLGSSLLARFEKLGDPADLNMSVATKEAAVELTPDGHPDKPLRLSNLGDSLQVRFESLGDIADLDGCVLTQEAAVRLTPEGHPGMPSRLRNLGISLSLRFERLGDLADINRSVLVGETAVELTPDDHPEKSPRLSSLGNFLLSRFDCLGDLADLDKAILMVETADSLTPDDHPRKPSGLNILGYSLMTRFERLGDLADINNAVIAGESAVKLTEDGHPDKPVRLSSLGNSLAVRFEQLGDLFDLNRSILMKETAVTLTPDGHPNKPLRLSNLGISLLYRFERLDDIVDLNRSVSTREDAVRLTPDDHPDMPSRLSGLASSSFRRFERLDDIVDLNKAVLLSERAVKLTSNDHPDKPLCLTNLGCFLLARFEQLCEFADLDRSVSIREVAVQLTPDGHPEKPLRLSNLGNSLHCRFEQLHEPLDFERMLLQYTSAASSTTGPSKIRFDASRLWAKYAHAAQHSSTFSAYTAAIDLLPELAWLGLSIRDRHHNIVKAGSLVRDAAAYAITVNRPEKAVEWLEQGRSIIWGQLLNLRSPVDALKDKHPELAAELTLLSTQLEGASIRSNIPQISESQSQESSESIAQQAHENAHKRAIVISKIRELKGFEQFLLPKTISQLSPAAKIGPVVFLNLSRTCCDALVLLPGLCNEVMHVPLTSFTPEHADSLTQSLEGLLRYHGRSDRLGKRERETAKPKDGFAYILSELWVHLVKPVLDALAIATPKKENLQRIWWCPTGPLTFLPIHAAGVYNEDEDTPGSKLTDFVISSYAPSLTALIEGLRPQSQSQMGLQLLAVAQPSASGQAHLPGTQEEIKCIQSHATRLTPGGALTVRTLTGDTATVNSVQECMRDCNWVHFACHGTQDSSNPTDSALLLAGSERLTLSKIIQLSLPHAQLAFLSACQTAMGDKTLQEESVHLTAGMLLAGYRGVIGTMWTIMDNDAPQVAGDVYEHLLKVSPPDPMRAAEALHLAVQRLRRQSGGTKSFFHWVPFIHVGV